MRFGVVDCVSADLIFVGKKIEETSRKLVTELMVEDVVREYDFAPWSHESE